VRVHDRAGVLQGLADLLLLHPLLGYRHGTMRTLLPSNLLLRGLLAAWIVAGICAVPSHAANAPRLAPRPETVGIINGAEATPEAYEQRWRAIVAITFASAPHDSFCGGTLIDERTVLTAAHCVHDPKTQVVDDPANIVVVVGRRVRSSDEGDVVPLEAVWPNAGYDPDGMANDVAILRLARAPVVPYATVAPARAASEWGAGAGWPLGDATVGPWIGGWGRTRVTDATSQSDALREAMVPIASDAACGSSTAPGNGVLVHTDSMVCAGSPATGTDVCKGDSGGPLMIGDGAGGWRQVGITSWTTGCAGPRWAVFTRVDAHVAWIDARRFVPLPAPTVQPPTADPSPAAGAAAPPAPPSAPMSSPLRADVVPPSIPGSVRVAGVTASSCDLAWRPSTDDRAISHYELQWLRARRWRGVDVVVASHAELVGLTPATRYVLRVRAIDASGNVSGWRRVGVRTHADVTPPTRPGRPVLRAGKVRWSASRDDVHVRMYLVWVLRDRRWRVSRRTVALTAARSALGTRAVAIQAVDEAGNRSARSRALSFG
jgi:secreted trypsin-like serine protease